MYLGAQMESRRLLGTDRLGGEVARGDEKSTIPNAIPNTLCFMVPCFPLELETILSPLYNYAMPTYEYACNKCGHQFEVVQSFSDAPIEKCPECTGEVKKVFSNVGVVFKGSGFYKTDSRKEIGRAHV